MLTNPPLHSAEPISIWRNEVIVLEEGPVRTATAQGPTDPVYSAFTAPR